jgi:predicted GNAT family acetyltransferase
MKLLLENWREHLKESTLDSIAQELGIKLDIYESGKDILVLSKIIVPEELRGQGMGSAAMKKIVQYADQNNKTIALTPSADFGGNKNKLIKFYKQFGFVMNRGRNKNYETQELMIREPK